MTGDDKNIVEALAGVDEKKRAAIMRLAKGAAFAAPVVAAFAMLGLSVRPAMAANSQFATSDRRLKRAVTPIGRHALGFGLYKFQYLWSSKTYVGVMAQEVQSYVPEAVKRGPGGFLAVDYGRLGFEMTEVGGA
jgi:Chaperone of endosialidase